MLNFKHSTFGLLILFILIGLYLEVRKPESEKLSKITKESKGCDIFIPSSDLLAFQEGRTLNPSSEENLVCFIKHQILGSSLKVNTNVGKEKHYSQAGQSELVDKLLHKKRGGFFVECGAHDGTTFSNSLFFQNFRNWTGILIEANPKSFRKLIRKNYMAYQLNACLSPTKEPRLLKFSPVGVYGGISNLITTHKSFVDKAMNYANEITVQCFSLYHIMKALQRDHIDYFSLDVEGAELDILKTIPWDRLKIDVLTVEYDYNKTLLDEYKTYMNSTGLYEYYGVLMLPKFRKINIENKESKGLDAVFVRKNLEKVKLRNVTEDKV